MSRIDRSGSCDQEEIQGLEAEIDEWRSAKVDTKTAAVTDVFQGLQFVRRRADRAR